MTQIDTVIGAKHHDIQESVVHNVTDFGDNRSLAVHITDEGIILDLYDVDFDGNDFLRASVGMMFDEWADWMENK